MRNSGNFIWKFIPRVIVGLVLAITVCANANAAGGKAVMCADQKKCNDVKIEDGSCNFFTTGVDKSTGECGEGYWYCQDDENGECAVYSCSSCLNTKDYKLVSVNKELAGETLCRHTLYDAKWNELSTSGDACMVVAVTSCNSGYYLSGGECLKCPSNATCSGGSASFSCKAGYYKSGTSCAACPEGTTSKAGSTSASACEAIVLTCAVECPSTEWAPAPSEYFSNYPYMETRCVLTSSSSSCESRCGAGSYDVDAGTGGYTKRCEPCPGGATSEAGALSVDFCFCRPNYYGIPWKEDGCQPCPPSYCRDQDPINGDKFRYPDCMDFNIQEYPELSPYMEQGLSNGGSYANQNDITSCFIPKGTEQGDYAGTFVYDKDCYLTE